MLLYVILVAMCHIIYRTCLSTFGSLPHCCLAQMSCMQCWQHLLLAQPFLLWDEVSMIPNMVTMLKIMHACQIVDSSSRYVISW